jgi:ABC-type Fe3+/spermidine/putrescine transport system ATPase subunit
VRVAANNGTTPGQAAILAIRPEKIDATAVAPADHGVANGNIVKARATAGSDLGDRSLILAEWREGAAPVSVSLQNRKASAGAESFAAEAPIWLTWPVEAGVLLNS